MHPLPFFGYSSHLPLVKQFNATAERMHTGGQFSSGLLTIEAPQILVSGHTQRALKDHSEIFRYHSEKTKRTLNSLAECTHVLRCADTFFLAFLHCVFSNVPPILNLTASSNFPQYLFGFHRPPASTANIFSPATARFTLC